MSGARRDQAPRWGAAWLLAAAVGFVFGGADQYLGSRVALGPWTSSVSAMSAPWLLVPFVFGSRAPGRRRAMAAGLLVTLAALAGYFALTVSPFEGVPLARVPDALMTLLDSNVRIILGGLLTGPLFGALGWRWRALRSWSSAALLAAAFCLEPLARLATGRLDGPTFVWGVEVVLGACLAAFFALAGAVHCRVGVAARGRPGQRPSSSRGLGPAVASGAFVCAFWSDGADLRGGDD